MASIIPLDSLDDWAARWESLAADDAAPLLVFKKSPICPVSHHVEARVTAWVASAPDDLAVVFVDVVNDRPVSQRIAADTGVTHQSPQALAIAAGGRVVWHDSHDRVDEDALDAALKALQ